MTKNLFSSIQPLMTLVIMLEEVSAGRGGIVKYKELHYYNVGRL